MRGPEEHAIHQMLEGQSHLSLCDRVLPDYGESVLKTH